MSGLHEVTCGACGRRHVMSPARARAQRVLRCECGEFVRIDRALGETRSEPPPAPAQDTALGDGFDDEETHMVSSLAEVAELGSSSSVAPGTGVVHEPGELAPRLAASSVIPSSRPSSPPASPSAPPPRPSSPVQRASLPASDKPLWYVDLGGSDTLEMTIEQLIIARRSGKLGEGALVWRAGMSNWRPIGTLIPATGSSPPRAVTPPAAQNRAPEAALPALGSYERPLATLEFALERPELPPSGPPANSPSPAKLRPASQQPQPRTQTPLPRPPAPGRPVAQRGPRSAASQVGPLPTRTPLPTPAAVPVLGPLPAPTPVPARPTSTMSPLLQRSSPLPPPHSVAPSAYQYPWQGQRPRWLSIGMAVLICIAASGSGAFVVRALKIRRQPLSLSPTPISAAPVVAGPKAPNNAAPPPLPEPATTTQVVDVDSLSIEHPAPRAPARPSAPVMPVAAPETQPVDKSAGNLAPSDVSPPAAATPLPLAEHKEKTSDLPAVASSNPYANGAVGDDPAKKPAPANSNDPGF